MTDDASEYDSTRGRPSSPDRSDDSSPDWVGYWKVRRYDGTAPSVPTYYEARLESWDVIKDEEARLHVARHPILDIQERHDGPGSTLVLMDEGADREDTEEWRVRVHEGTLRVTAMTGPHAGAVGVAERITDDPRARASS